jgi:hypothetical protein
VVVSVSAVVGISYGEKLSRAVQRSGERFLHDVLSAS